MSTVRTVRAPLDINFANKFAAKFDATVQIHVVFAVPIFDIPMVYQRRSLCETFRIVLDH